MAKKRGFLKNVFVLPQNLPFNNWINLTHQEKGTPSFFEYDRS